MSLSNDATLLNEYKASYVGSSFDPRQRPNSAEQGGAAFPQMLKNEDPTHMECAIYNF